VNVRGKKRIQERGCNAAVSKEKPSSSRGGEGNRLRASSSNADPSRGRYVDKKCWSGGEAAGPIHKEVE